MTLTEVHVALKQAGIESAIADEVAEVMVRQGHLVRFTDQMTSGHVAKTLWLSFIAHDLAAVAVESQLLLEGKSQPQQRGEVNGDSIVQYIGQLVRNESMAANVSTMEVDPVTRHVRVQLRDDRELHFETTDKKEQQTERSALVIGGTFLCRCAMAYSSRVWLPIKDNTITHVQD